MLHANLSDEHYFYARQKTSSHRDELTNWGKAFSAEVCYKYRKFMQIEFEYLSIEDKLLGLESSKQASNILTRTRHWLLFHFGQLQSIPLLTMETHNSCLFCVCLLVDNFNIYEDYFFAI